MIIDFHAHVLPPRIKKDRGRYVEKDAAFAQIYSGEKVKIATAEDLIAGTGRLCLRGWCRRCEERILWEEPFP